MPLPPRSWVNTDAHDLLVSHLVAAREGAGFTQRDLAQRVKKDPSTIARIETGQRNVSVLEFVMLARALGRDPREFFSLVVDALPNDLGL